jgi:hypothetical protein
MAVSDDRNIEVADRRELSPIELDVGSILAVDEAISGCKEFLNLGYVQEYLRDLKTSAEANEREVVRGVIRRKREVILSSDYYGELWTLSREIREKHTIPLVEKLETYEALIFKVMKKLNSIEDNLDIFLRYFFPTPVNRSAGKREWEETVPVEESILFGLYRHPVPFKKSGQEKFASMSENLQALGSILDPNLTDPLVRRVTEASNDFNRTLLEAAKELAPLSKAKLKPDETLSLDVRVLNYALTQMAKRPYSGATGLFGIMAVTALRRVGERLDPSIKELMDEIYCALRRISSSYHYGLEEIGYTVKDRPTLRDRLAGHVHYIAVKDKKDNQ